MFRGVLARDLKLKDTKELLHAVNQKQAHCQGITNGEVSNLVYVGGVGINRKSSLVETYFLMLKLVIIPFTDVGKQNFLWMVSFP